nr:MAG TPA: hypothetical protein [Bacteriophage sp.]
MLKGINESSKCFHEIYDKNEIDEMLQGINQNINTGGTATTANTESINDIKQGNLASSIQISDEDGYIDSLGGTTGFKVYSSTSTSETPTPNGLLMHIGKSATDSTQIFIDGKDMYIRNYANGVWSTWSVFNKDIKITSGTAAPSGGNDGDIYFKYS